MPAMNRCTYVVILLVAQIVCACGGGDPTSPQTSAPFIQVQPTSVVVYEGFEAEFVVEAASGGSLRAGGDSLRYQWKKNGIDIDGATASSWKISRSALADNGAAITVAVIGNGGTVISSQAMLTVIALKPVIVVGPAPQTAISGSTVTFSVAATGFPPLNYQWFKNGQAIPSANGSTYTTPVTVGDNSATYYVTVSNTAGSELSVQAELTVNVSTLTDLVISEVSTCHSNVDCWFEIYNPTKDVKKLQNYVIQSSTTDISGAGAGVAQKFALPDQDLLPDSYIVFTGNSNGRIQFGNQNILLVQGNYVPKWISKGFIELLGSSGETVDFIRIGTSGRAPTTGSWDGAVNIPYGTTDYGKSAVRLYPHTADTKTNSAADWELVNWVTPGGRNDVPSDARDDDGDGIPDSAEVPGGTFAGLDLYSMGARVGQKDLFIEVDRMQSADPWLNPNKKSLAMVKAAFAAKNINVVFDVGDAFSPAFSAEDFNLGQGSNIVPYEPCATLDQTTCIQNSTSRRSLYDWKDESMDIRRRPIFHYVLFGNSQKVDGVADSSGRAEIIGNDILITMGNWPLPGDLVSNSNRIINFHAGTIMHELGHNLGLRHGGKEDLNYKPNYWSVMNYLYQLNGLDPDPRSVTAYERWKYTNYGTPGRCFLVASACGTPSNFVINYSEGSGGNLDENSLSESENIGYGSNLGAFADWNIDGSLTSTVFVKDLNGDNINSILADYNDWANLIFPFARYQNGNAGIAMKQKISNFVSPVLDDRQTYVVETLTPGKLGWK